ncbi:MAG: hypothetical protein M3524_02825, partial [Actinomycetota bacterium]|nr:hypothetical protein [Actinomycetota bacterium]
KGHALLLDAQRRPRRWVTVRDLTDGPLEEAGTPVEAVLQEDVTLQDVVQEMLTATLGEAIIVDSEGRYLGALNHDTINTAVRAMQQEAVDREREQARAGMPEAGAIA